MGIETYLEFINSYDGEPPSEQASKIRTIRDPQEIGRYQEYCDAGIVDSNKFFTLLRDPVVFPSSRKRGTYLRLVPRPQKHPGDNSGVVVVPVLGDKLVLIRSYRHPIQSFECGFPRGNLDVGKTEVEMVREEMLQETGYQIGSVKLLGHVCPDSGLLSAKVAIYRAEITGTRGETAHEETEMINQDLLMLTPLELAQHISSGEIVDAFTISGFLLFLLPQLTASGLQGAAI